MLPFIGAGISLISGAVSNLFTGEGRARRQARRLERRQKRAARQAGRITVKQPAARKPYYPPTAKLQPAQAEIKAPRKPAGDWLKENWYFVAGGAAVLLLIVFMTSKKKKVVKRRKKSNPGSGSSGSSNPRKKSSTGGSFATRARRVNREWKKAKAAGSQIKRKAAWAKWG